MPQGRSWTRPCFRPLKGRRAFRSRIGPSREWRFLVTGHWFLFPGAKAELTRPPVLAVDEEKEIRRGIATTLAATGLATILLWLTFCSLRYTRSSPSS